MNTEMNFEQARFNMIEQQIRPWDVLDQRVLDVIGQIPREDFVPERYRKLAFADVRIPLGHDQVMMNPNVEGRLLQALAIKPTDKILEVGTGSGYLSACLAHLGASVVSVDIIAEFAEQAGTRLTQHGINNVRLFNGDASQDWDDEPFDVIALTGSLPTLPDSWRQRLALDGRLFAIIGTLPIMEAILITRTRSQEWLQESLFETELPALVHTDQTPAIGATFEF